MSYVLQMPLDDGGSLLVETAEPDESTLERVGRAGQPVAQAAETLQQALGRLRPAIGAIVTWIRQSDRPPDRIGLQFGITFTAEAGVVVARASTEANFTVTVEWTSQDQRG